ncbi:hypothetical protein CAEBREN_29817, partial [Caenorhabditis brenneri]
MIKTVSDEHGELQLTITFPVDEVISSVDVTTSSVDETSDSTVVETSGTFETRSTVEIQSS